MYENVKLKEPSLTTSKESADAVKSVLSDNKSLMHGFIIAVVILIAGDVLAYIAEKDLSSIVFSMIYLFLGLFIIFICKGNRYEYRTFMFSYSICVFVAGLSFIYSVENFDTLMSTIDSKKFFNAINSPAITIKEIIIQVDSVLPVLVWKQLAALRQALNVGGHGPGIYVFSNALLVAISGVFVTKIANELFEKNDKRLRLVGVLFSLSGMMWLFGSILIRDAYALLLNTICVWVLVKVLITPTSKNLILTLIVTAISAWLMWYVRDKAIYLFVVFIFMAFGIWYLKSNFTPAKMLLTIVFMAIMVASFKQISTHATIATDTRAKESEKYAIGSKTGSLGASLVVNQSLPVRVFTGSAYLLIFPIPIWGYFKIGLPEYYIIKGISGLFIILLMPNIIYSSFRIVGKKSRRKVLFPAMLFLLLYFLLTLVIVAITTLETRHHGQFFSGLILLAAMPVFKTSSDKLFLKNIRIVWFGIIFFGHMLWLFIKM